jgi:hypothetical protein
MDTIDTTTSDMVDPASGVPDPALERSAIPESTNPKQTQSQDSPINRQVKTKISQWRRFVREMIPEWTVSISYRRGKPFATDTDEDRVIVNTDWPNTKRKQAQLYSQTPKVRLTAKHPNYQAGLPAFARKLNDTLLEGGVEDAFFEMVPDIVNACGVGAVHIAYETRDVMKDFRLAPSQPPPQLVPDGTRPMGAVPPAPGVTPQTTQVPYTTARRTVITRISPSDLIADLSFTGSNFNRSSLIGRRGRMRWAEAIKEFGYDAKKRPNGLKPADKQDVVGRDNRDMLDRLSQQDVNRQNYTDTEVVLYDEVFYWRYLYDPTETSFEAIQRVVFVNGKREPVIDEPWTGQKRDGDTIYGSCLPPIQVCTLDYLTDEVIPPSTTAIARPTTDELIEGRTQMILQRRFSIPIRWMDNNRVPQELITVLMRGQWQGIIPMNGPGDRAFGEVSKAAFPRENMEFNSVAKMDNDSIWSTGSSLSGGGAGNTQVRSAAEANAVVGGIQTIGAMERARITRTFVNVAQVAAGLLSLYGQWTDEEKTELGGLDPLKLSQYYSYNILADSTVLLDANQEYAKVQAFFDHTFKTGYVDPLPLLKRMADLAGVDSTIVRPPSGVKPEPLNISLRLSGAEELDDPRIVALLMHSGQMFTPQELEAAKNIIIQSKQVPAPQDPNAPPADQPPAGAKPGEPGAHQPPPQLQPTHPFSGNAHVTADLASRVNTRTHDGA